MERNTRYDPDRHHRRSIRLRDYDYSQPGMYFVTVCTKEPGPFFGIISDDKMQLSEPGEMVKHWWFELNAKFPTVQTDEFVIMPNHVHGIVGIVGADLRVRPGFQGKPVKGGHIGPPLPRIMQWFKTMTTNDYIRAVKILGWPQFPGRLWQRGYYDHIIRDERTLHRIRRYIRNNPFNWTSDPQNPTTSEMEKAYDWLFNT